MHKYVWFGCMNPRNEYPVANHFVRCTSIPGMPTDRTRLGQVPWPALENGVDTVVLPLGSTEQHGPHLPLDTDTRIATALAERIATRLGTAVVAPSIPVGPSMEHAGFPGTISISPDTLEQLLREYVESFERSGFRRVIIVPGHGGSFPVVERAFPELARTTDIDVIAITDLQWYMDLLQEGLHRADVDVDEPVVHAGASETALMLTLAPDLVGPDRPQGHTGPVSAATLYSEGIETYDENGVLGDAREATADVGNALLEVVTDAYYEYIQAEIEAQDGSQKPS